MSVDQQYGQDGDNHYNIRTCGRKELQLFILRFCRIRYSIFRPQQTDFRFHNHSPFSQPSYLNSSQSHPHARGRYDSGTASWSALLPPPPLKGDCYILFTCQGVPGRGFTWRGRSPGALVSYWASSNDKYNGLLATQVPVYLDWG